MLLGMRGKGKGGSSRSWKRLKKKRKMAPFFLRSTNSGPLDQMISFPSLVFLPEKTFTMLIKFSNHPLRKKEHRHIIVHNAGQRCIKKDETPPRGGRIANPDSQHLRNLSSTKSQSRLRRLEKLTGTPKYFIGK